MSINASVCQQVIQWLIDWHEASSASVCVCAAGKGEKKHGWGARGLHVTSDGDGKFGARPA